MTEQYTAQKPALKTITIYKDGTRVHVPKKPELTIRTSAQEIEEFYQRIKEKTSSNTQDEPKIPTETGLESSYGF